MKRTMIAIPAMDMVHTAFVQSLLGMRREECMIAIARSSLVYDARNLLSQKAIDEGYDRILWLDSDMVFHQDLFYRLTEDLNNGYPIVCGIYFTRKGDVKPVLYSETGYEALNNGTGQYKTYSKVIEDYPKDDIFEVNAIGFAAVMMEVSILKDVFARYGAPFFPTPGFGEDLSFCRRLNEMGVRMFCDSRIKVGHIAQYTVDEEAYLAGDIVRMWD